MNKIDYEAFMKYCKEELEKSNKKIDEISRKAEKKQQPISEEVDRTCKLISDSSISVEDRLKAADYGVELIGKSAKISEKCQKQILREMNRAFRRICRKGGIRVRDVKKFINNCNIEDLEKFVEEMGLA